MGACGWGFEVTYRLAGSNVVEMAARLLNRRADKTQYPGRQQEMPALYTNGRWYRMLTYAGRVASGFL